MDQAKSAERREMLLASLPIMGGTLRIYDGAPPETPNSEPIASGLWRETEVAVAWTTPALHSTESESPPAVYAFDVNCDHCGGHLGWTCPMCSYALDSIADKCSPDTVTACPRCKAALDLKHPLDVYED